MHNANIPNAAPEAVYAGKPRSFWTILGLSVITCGIYYVVYNFMVASELKRATPWREDEPFKPSTYMVMYGAYAVLGRVFPMVFGLAVSAKLFMAIIANPNSVDSEILNVSNSSQLYLQIFMILVNVVGFYVAYYFLKLNDIASAKVGARPIGIRPAFIAQSVFFVAMMLQSLFGIFIIVMDINPSISGNINNIDDLGPFLLLALMSICLGLFSLVSGAYYLWRQTELVNHVWEAGIFATPVGGRGFVAAQTVPPAQFKAPASNPESGSPVRYPSPPLPPETTIPAVPPAPAPAPAPPARDNPYKPEPPPTPPPASNPPQDDPNV